MMDNPKAMPMDTQYTDGDSIHLLIRTETYNL